MTTWASLRDNTLRHMLKDTAVVPNWTDVELMAYANFALAELSNAVPKSVAVTLVATGDSFDLPTDLRSITSIYDSVLLTILDRYEPIPGYQETSLGYYLDWPSDGLLTLTQTPSRDLILTYSAYRTQIALETDTIDLGRHRWAEEALCYYCCYLAHMREGVGRAALEQWATRRDLNVGNPLNLEAREWKVRYDEVMRKNRNRSS